MNKINKTIAAIALVSAAPFAAAEISFNAALTSDYVFRGVTQSDSGFAFQGGADYANENGFFAGTWASTVDYSQYGDDTNLEIDFYAGYYGETADFAYDVMYNMYTYYGEDYSDEGNYGEIIANGYFGSFTATFGYANDYFGTGESVTYLGGAYDIELPNDYALTLNAGYSLGEDALGEDIIDFGATVAKTFNGFDVTAAIVGTDMDSEDSDTRLVLGVTRSF